MSGAAPNLSTLFRESLKVGCLGFGGPAGQIALMHRVFVDERAWIDDARFQRMLAFCMLLPGPEAQQLATYVGWRLRGWAGALIAGWLFVLPGAFVVLALSALYVVYGTQPLVIAAFDGVKCAVVALVIEALVKVGKRALKTPLALWIAIAAFVALLFNAPFPLVIVAAALIGALLPSPLWGGQGGGASAKSPDVGATPPLQLLPGRGRRVAQARTALGRPMARAAGAGCTYTRHGARALPSRAGVLDPRLRHVWRRVCAAGVSHGRGGRARLADQRADDRWLGARGDNAGATDPGQ
jgi:chromate transporter